MSFLLLIKDGNNNSFPQIHLHNTNAFLEDLTGKHFYNVAYKLHFLHTDLPMLHKRVVVLRIFVNIAHIRSKTLRCIRKYVKFVKVSFQVLIK